MTASEKSPDKTDAQDSAERATRQLLDDFIANGKTPGVQYVFASPDSILLEHNAGLANPRDRTPVTAETTFNSFSVTKTFTAAAVLSLVDQGEIDLDLPLADYLTAWPQLGLASVRQTLLHRAGFKNPNPMRWTHLADDHATFSQAAFINEIVAKYGQPVGTPGKRYAYSNVGYLILGELIQQVSGQSYCEFVRQRLIQPLCLLAGETIDFRIEHPDTHAPGHQRRFGWLSLVLPLFINRNQLVATKTRHWVQFHHNLVNGAAYGGLVGNARGFAHFLQAMLAGDTVLSTAMRTQLFERVPVSGVGRSLGWFTGELNAEPWLAHAGGGAGYYCEVRLYPRIRRASVVMFNRSGIRDEKVLDRVDQHLILINR